MKVASLVEEERIIREKIRKYQEKEEITNARAEKLSSQFQNMLAKNKEMTSQLKASKSDDVILYTIFFFF